MTLQENIDAMTKIANTADKDDNVAREELVSTITSNRTELMALGSKMTTVPKFCQPTLTTFDSEYISLFMSAFRKVDTLLTKVLNGTAITEDEFLCPEFTKIGIEYFPQGPVEKIAHVSDWSKYDDIYTGEPVEIRYATSPTSTAIPASGWGTEFKQWIDTAALKCRKVDGTEYYMTIPDLTAYMVCFDKLPVDTPAAVTDGTRSMGYSFVQTETITDPVSGCTGHKVTMTRIGGVCFTQFLDEDITEDFVSYSNFGQMLYKFDKFLMGYFGTKATTKGQEDLLKKFVRKAKDNEEAEQWANWFNSEAKEFGNPTAMSIALSTPRSIEYAASLYSVKFALMKIVYGHARRLQFG